MTLDTTRADALGAYGGGARTPVLDALAARGVRFDEALAAVPLTLPAHATLFTGLDPIEHGLRDNGAGRLAAEVPTLAALLKERGYATGGVIASRVLDRRFGLDRGFDSYDETMAAERLGEYGYPERSATAVVDAALAWARSAENGRPHFLWVHFYDPHSPYSPPGGGDRSGGSDLERYLAEIGEVDREIGRLLSGLSALRGPNRERIVAVVGDHGESLGEHGEREHGLLLSRAVLRVPLILSGSRIPQGRNVPRPVATKRLAATLLALLDRAAAPDSGARGKSKVPVKGMLGLPISLELEDLGKAVGASGAGFEPVYHETVFPLSAFGWGALFAVTEGSLRFVLGPKPRVVDWVADPQELRSAPPGGDSSVRRLQKDLKSLLDRKLLFPPAAVEADSDLAATLQNLGYLSGQSSSAGSSAGASAARLDPSAGLGLLERFKAAKKLLSAGDTAAALTAYQQLTTESPGSVPFWMERGGAERALGHFDDALRSLEQARRLNPTLDFIDLRLGDAFAAAGRGEEAETAWRRALERNPRFAQAALAYGEWLARKGRAADEEKIVRAAVAAGTSSVFLLARLAQIEMAKGALAAADEHLAEATRLVPEFSTAWKLWAEVARRQGRPADAAQRSERAYELSRP